MDDLVKTFLEHLKLPAVKADRPFILGIIGNIGAGKTTVARAIVDEFPGSVHIQGDSARFILKEQGMPWGENVRAILHGATRQLVRDGYAVIIDGSVAEQHEREHLADFAKELDVPLMFVRVRCEPEVCEERVRRKYEDTSWESTFDDFRVNTTEKMLDNVRERSKFHHDLKSADIDNLVGQVDGNQPPSEVAGQVAKFVKAIHDKQK